ncbi:MAG: DUF2267 domain-containing protein [Paracoccaceae bacterium]|nr:DUF2267 domain-containing protein [Paracoccaceae bacterium]
MTAHGLEVIDHSVHLTHEWTNELAGRLGWSSKRSALRLMRVTLHRIRDHLLVDELAQLSAQLPLLIRGFFFEGWVPKNTPVRERHAHEFIAVIDAEMENSAEYRGREDIKCVFDLLNARVSAGEIEDIRASLPSDLRQIWAAP